VAVQTKVEVLGKLRKKLKMLIRSKWTVFINKFLYLVLIFYSIVIVAHKTCTESRKWIQH